jgi:hypothetical protein
VTDRTLVSLFETQAHYCHLIGSPLYGHLLERGAEDLAADGPTRDVLHTHENDDLRSMIPLRLLGAVHRAVLRGDAPALAAFYPSAGGRADPDGAWRALRELLVSEGDRLSRDMDAPVQTNEVGRCASLLGGFLLVAARTGLPLRILEVGASAGLNLSFDRYFYTSGDQSWGARESPVRFAEFISGESFPWHVEASILERNGCDASPLDPTSERDVLTLKSFVWPDQSERFELLSAALDFAGANPVPVERADAAEWTERQLASPAAGLATVIFHSMMLFYLDDKTRERMLSAIQQAGARASDDAPLAWLRMELGGDEAAVHLTTWPGGEERLVARAGYQGRPVSWLGRE